MNPAPDYLRNALEIVGYLQSHNIHPILYGSTGASLYLGQFKTFSDVDLLIDGEWLKERWADLISLMKDRGFVLVDEREHEFKRADGLVVAFAEETVLTRDKILESLGEVIEKSVGSMKIRTLSPRHFKKAYEFSEKDGYRASKRGKKDRSVIDLLATYINEHADAE